MEIFHYLLAFGILNVFVIYVFRYHYKIKLKQICLTLGLYSLPIAMVYFNILTKNFNILLGLLTIIGLSILYYFAFNKKSYQLYLYVLKSYYLIIFALIITFTFTEIIMQSNLYLFKTQYYVMAVSFICAIILYVIIEVLFLKYFTKDVQVYTMATFKPYLFNMIILLLSAKNLSLIYIILHSKHATSVSLVVFGATALDGIFEAVAIFGLNKAFHLSISKHQNQIINLQYQLQNSSLKQLEQHQQHIRQITHDYRNHNLILSSLIKQKAYQQALIYLDQLGYQIDEHGQMLHTNHKMLNSLINVKKATCQNHHLQFNIDLKIPEIISLQDFDLCIIVGNLLDNAIEAAQNCNDGAYVNIIAKIINQNFVLEIINNYNHQLTPNNDAFVTSKQDKKAHGLGITNVKMTVEKYNGYYRHNFTENVFSTLIMIPINE